MESPQNSETKWTRTDTNFWLDSLLLVSFSTLVAISVVVRYVFPRPNTAQDWQLWSRSLDDWMQYQFYALAAFSLLVLLHVMLHWSWVCNVFVQRVRKNKKRKMDEGVQTIVGVGMLILLLNIVGLFVAAAALTIHSPQ